MQMQRIPARSVPIKTKQSEAASGEAFTAAVSRNGSADHSASPLYLLADRIKNEQGAEQVKCFLEAMRPFAAPNELKLIGKRFGLELEAPRAQASETPAKQQQTANNNASLIPQLQMLQKLMCLQSIMNGGKADASELIRMLGGMQQ